MSINIQQYKENKNEGEKKIKSAHTHQILKLLSIIHYWNCQNNKSNNP